MLAFLPCTQTMSIEALENYLSKCSVGNFLYFELRRFGPTDVGVIRKM